MTHYVIFTADVQLLQITKLRQALIDAVNGGATEIYLAISSGGGLVVEGLSIAAILRSLPVEVTTHNIGQTDSVANVIFASGKKRVSNSTASFLFHGVTQPLNNIVCTENQLADIHKSVVRSRETIAANIASYTGIPATDINTLMMSGDTILTAQEALTKTLIHEVTEFSMPPGAKFTCIGNA